MRESYSRQRAKNYSAHAIRAAGKSTGAPF